MTLTAPQVGHATSHSTGQRVGVRVEAWDPILRAGVVSHLRPRPEIRLLGDDEAEEARVGVVVADAVDERTTRLLKQRQRSSSIRMVLVAGRLDDSDVVVAAEAGAVGLLRRHEATADRLVTAIVGAASDEGTVPSDLLGRLLGQVGALQRGFLGPRGLTFNGLATREIEVLRLVAEGCDTQEIADKLAYSERTVKNVLHDVTTRLQLRNRSHAVAYALREGLI
jgi:DNA-binding NarL/FixJ family response regulator